MINQHAAGENAITKKKLISVYAIILMYAVYLTLLGHLLPRIISYYDLSLAGGGLISTLQSIGGFAAVFVSLFVVDALNKAKVFGLCAVLLSIATLVVGFSPVMVLLFITFALLGIFITFIDILANVVIVDRTSGQKQRFLINLLHGFFSVGAVMGPLAAEGITSRFDWQTMFYVFAAVLFVCALFYLYSFKADIALPLKQAPVNRETLGALKKVLRKKGMKAVAVTSICTNFFLVGIIYWLSTYVSSLENDYLHGALALSLFFVGVMGSRIGLSKLMTRVNGAVLVGTGAALSSLFFAAGLLPGSPYAAMILFGLCGFSLGPIFPQTVSMACSIAPENTGTASGIVYFGFIAANMLSPLVIGAIADIEGIGLRLALLVPAAVSLIGAVVVLRIRRSVGAAGEA